VVSKNQTVFRVCIAKEGKLFKIENNVCMGFLQYLKTHSLPSFHPNVLKLGMAGNSDLLFHVMYDFFVIKIFIVFH